MRFSLQTDDGHRIQSYGCGVCSRLQAPAPPHPPGRAGARGLKNAQKEEKERRRAVNELQMLNSCHEISPTHVRTSYCGVHARPHTLSIFIRLRDGTATGRKGTRSPHGPRAARIRTHSHPRHGPSCGSFSGSSRFTGSKCSLPGAHLVPQPQKPPSRGIGC